MVEEAEQSDKTIANTDAKAKAEAKLQKRGATITGCNFLLNKPPDHREGN